MVWSESATTASFPRWTLSIGSACSTLRRKALQPSLSYFQANSVRLPLDVNGIPAGSREGRKKLPPAGGGFEVIDATDWDTPMHIWWGLRLARAQSSYSLCYFLSAASGCARADLNAPAAGSSNGSCWRGLADASCTYWSRRHVDSYNSPAL